MFPRITAAILLLTHFLCGYAQAQVKPELEYYVNGQVKLETIYNKRGEKAGLEKLYYPTGELWSRSMYLRDRKDGIEKLYYKNGNIMKLKPYNKGMLEGMERSYWRNGNLMEEVPYVDGAMTGTARYYNMDGSLLEEKIWENDELKKTIPAATNP
jgi:antitoxin component YwqK of YwqJK toxin-antitoxin module